MNKDRKEYLREYNQKNREKLKAYREKWVSENPEKVKESQRRSREKHKESRRGMYKESKIKYLEGSIEDFLRKKMSRISMREKTCRESAKSKFQECDLTLEHLVELWNQQEHKCALTGKTMNHKLNSMFSVTIDRIDSNIGYIKSNVQLVCQAANYAKNKFTNDQFLQFWNNDKESS